MQIFKERYFLSGLLIFALMQILFNFFLIDFHQRVPFNTYLYGTAYHYIDDNRTQNEPFNLINALSAWDGQWYMRVAGSGYTTIAEVKAHQGQKFLDKYAYAFLPLYPALVSIVNIFFQNVLLAAFVFNNIVLIATFFSMYYIVSKLYSRETAMKTNFLLLFFPLSIFFRAYYSEGLFLLLLLWFGYSLIKRKWWIVGMTITLLLLTKPNGAFLYLPLFIILVKEVIRKRLKIWRALGIFCLPLLTYGYLYINSKIFMHDGWFWINAHSYWGPKYSILQTVSRNIQSIFHFSKLPFHKYSTSQTEIVAFFAGLFFLFVSRKMRYPILWVISLSLLLLPLIVKSFTSYARYEIVIFPLFIYLATKLKGLSYNITVAIFYILLLSVSLHFINWDWIE